MEVLKQLKNIDVYKLLKDTGAILEGHFKLTSGNHSKYYLQCAKLLQYPHLVSKLLKCALVEYSEDIKPDNVDTIISPAMGGILFGYMLAYKLNKKMVFTERKNKEMELRRGFNLNKGERVYIAEDVITTGGSVFEVIDICRDLNADIKGIISIVDRSENLKFDYNYKSIIKLSIEKYPPEQCPLCNSGIELIYPGSRN